MTLIFTCVALVIAATIGFVVWRRHGVAGAVATFFGILAAFCVAWVLLVAFLLRSMG